MLQLLPKQSLSGKLVEKRPALSLEAFLQDYFLPASPVILSDCMAHWPTRVKWNDTDYLKKVAGSRTVPVEVMKSIFGRDICHRISVHVLQITSHDATKKKGKKWSYYDAVVKEEK